jgi:homoserine dehydrogenase
MKQYDVSLVGFGNVNRAFARLVAESNDSFAAEFGFRLNFVAVTDLHFGSVISVAGIDAQMLAETPFEKGALAKLPGGSAHSQNERVIKHVPADIVIEATYTNPVDGEPAVSHCRWALETGKHVATTNKGPVAFAASSLKALAARNGVAFEFEGSVMSGTPVIRMARRTLGGAGISGFEGILNGTSNFVLGRMESGLDFASAVKEAQMLGYAEADPAADIEGHDVRLKVAILANELLGARISPGDVACRGISGLTSDDLAAASAQGRRWKLIGSAHRDEQGAIVASVAPFAIASDHPLAGIGGATNAISFKTRLLGNVTVAGPGAGRVETAYALLSDIIAIHQTEATPMVGRTSNRQHHGDADERLALPIL